MSGDRQDSVWVAFDAGHGDLSEEISALYREIERSLPADAKKIGYVADIGNKEVPLWKPLWSRRVVRVRKSETATDLAKAGGGYLFVDPSVFRPIRFEEDSVNYGTIEKFLERYPGEVVRTFKVRADPQESRESCYLVKLRENSEAIPN